jgi:hypothetical protein
VSENGRYRKRDPSDPAPAANAIQADRRLYVSDDGSRVVEEDDPTAGFLLIQRGGWIEPEDVLRYGLLLDGRTVVLPQKKRTPLRDKMRLPTANKARR